MKTASKYWNLVRLDSSGKLKITEVGRAKQFFWQQFSNRIDYETLSDTEVQKDLVAIKNSQSKDSYIAERCLRCFVSHQIRQVCIQLDMQFGREHGFSRKDLFIYTLNDTLDNRDSTTTSAFGHSRINETIKTARIVSPYKPLAVEILETFEPNKANLSTWTARYVKQNRELQRFLLEQGVYLISNWAILNDTKIKQISRVLSEFHNLTPTEIKQAEILLYSYHAVYRRDRLKNRQGKSKCQTPSAEQLTRLAGLIEQQGLIFSAEQTLSRLEQLANQLREYRIHVRGGKIKQESLDRAAKNTEEIQAAVVDRELDNSEARSNFLKSYQQQFQQSLDSSIKNVIEARLSRFRGKKAAKAPQFITALKLFHCQGETMSAIAPKIDLQAQYQVTRLLKLKELRTDIRHQMLQLMQNWTLARARAELELESLKQREQEIEFALGEQIDLVLDEAEKEVSIADSTQSILAKRICDYLDRHHK